MKSEYNHIISVTKKLRTFEEGSDKWWSYFRWIEDRVNNGWKIGELDYSEFMQLTKYLKKIETTCRANVSKAAAKEVTA